MSLMIWSVVLAAALMAPEPNDGVAARYRNGVVTRSELAEWSDHRGHARTETVAVQQLVEELVLLRVLDAMYRARGLDELVAHRARLDISTWDLATRWLKRRIAGRSEPSEAELRAAFQADPERFREPRRWRLENIFIRWPGDDEDGREDARQTMAAIRRRISAGEDFAALAATYSESQTRSRGGRLGTVSLDRLAPPVAEEVEKMSAGSLSPVIETADGLTLIRCAGVIPGVEPSFEAARETLAKQLRRQAFERAWTELDDRLLEALEPRYQLEKLTAESPPGLSLATVRAGEARSMLTLEDLTVFLATRKIGRPAHELPRDVLEMRLEERILLEARAAEARRRGCEGDAELRTTVEWMLVQLRARLALDSLVAEQDLPKASPDELRGMYRNRRHALKEPQRLKLQALQAHITADRPAEDYEMMRRLGEELEAGRASFDAVAERLAAFAEWTDLGWMTQAQVWLMGRNVTEAVTGLEPGGSSRVVQEGRALYILHLEERTEERELTFEEAEPALLASWNHARRLEAEDSIRRRIIDEQEIVMTTVGETNDAVDE